MTPARLFLGDWREAGFERERCGAIITDPPYETEMHKRKADARKLGHHRNGRGLQAIDFAPITDGDRADLTSFAKACCDGWMLVFCTAEGVAAWRDAIEAAGLRYKRAMPWVKPDSTPQFNGQGPAHCLEMIVAAWCGKGASRWNGGGKRGWFSHSVNNPERTGKHPTEKPRLLMEELVRDFSQPGDLVVDPYAGSGTTGVAALRHGRRFAGAEFNAEYHALAAGRLRIAASVEGVELGPLFERTVA